jgi:DNA replication protein DnaC
VTDDNAPQSIGEALAARTGQLAEKASTRPPRRPSIDLEDPELDEFRAFGLGALRDASWSTIIPSRFARASLDDLPDGEVRSCLEEWSRSPQGRNLVLLGPVGTGKTHAAVAACRPAHYSGLTVQFSPLVELLDSLRPQSREEMSLWDLVDIDRLIIDDLGSERPTDWTAERLYALLNRRWLEERPTIVTTNLEASALEEAVGPRSFSRLVGNDAVVLRLSGKDRRRKR